MSEQVNHPSHYASGGIECIDAMEAAFGKAEVASFCKLNAFKYLWRCFKKGDKGVEDVAMLAIEPNNGRWKHNEYLQQYPCISYENSLFRVTMPDGNSMPLYDWLTNK